jgi:hypothetical protein
MQRLSVVMLPPPSTIKILKGLGMNLIRLDFRRLAGLFFKVIYINSIGW